MVSARGIIALTLVGLFGCGSDPQPQATNAAASASTEVIASTAKNADAPPLSPLPEKRFGAAITETSDTPLDAIVRDPGSFKDKTLRTTGVVTAVCQHMGCWMEIGDAEKKAHIKMAGHSFFVPKNASGHHAIVQGKLTGADPLASACGHEGENSCGGEANGVVAKLEIEAMGVEFID